MITVQEIKKKLKILRTNRDIRKVILFGSYAKSDASPRSDIDLVAIINTTKRFFDRYDLFDIFYDFFDVPVDILPYTEEEFKRISHRKFIRMIIREGIVVYDSEKKVNMVRGDISIKIDSGSDEVALTVPTTFSFSVVLFVLMPTLQILPTL